jgi:hypothetical protein
MSPPEPNDLVPGLVPASRLVARPIDWLWPGWLPLGKLAILDGDSGLGKSLLTLDLCARLSTGRPFPDDRPGPQAAAAIVLNGEDDAEDTILPRLRATGADVNKVYVWHGHADGAREPIRFPSGAAWLERAVAQTGARLVVIDPIKEFLDPGVNPASDRSVRWALDPLGDLAARHRCAVLLLRHLNKYGGHRALYRGSDSIAFVSVCRSAWLVARDPQGPERCVLAEVKKNLGPTQPGLAYSICGGEGVTPTVGWRGPSPWLADQLLAAAAAAPPPVLERERARAFLANALEAGPRTSRELWPLAQRARLSRRTLRRARGDLKIRSVRVCAEGKRLSYWLLPGQQLPSGLSPESATPELDEYLARLNEQFPPSTPLDDL